MDDLHAEFARLKSRKDSRRLADLRRFQERLGGMTFFDPACGCGNFLIIAYRELRLIEIEVLKAIRVGTQLELDATTLSRVDVDQFHGIEIGEFPTRIAETAMWMMDPHHEQPAEPGVRPDICANSSGKVAAYRPRRRVGKRLVGLAATGGLLLRVRQSALRGG